MNFRRKGVDADTHMEQPPDLPDNFHEVLERMKDYYTGLTLDYNSRGDQLEGKILNELDENFRKLKEGIPLKKGDMLYQFCSENKCLGWSKEQFKELIERMGRLLGEVF